MKILANDIVIRVTVEMSPELVGRVDAACGQGARGRFIRAAVERELENCERKVKEIEEKIHTRNIRCEATNYPLGEPPLLRCILDHGHELTHVYELRGIRMEMGSNDPTIRTSPADEIEANRKLFGER